MSNLWVERVVHPAEGLWRGCAVQIGAGRGHKVAQGEVAAC